MTIIRAAVDSRRIPEAVPIALGGAGLVLGSIGYVLEYPGDGSAPWQWLLTTLWRAAALFVLQADVDQAHDNGWLAVARIIAPAATLSAIYNLCANMIAQHWRRLRLTRLGGHTVIIGAGERGSAFFEHESRLVPACVVIDADATVLSSSAYGRQFAILGDARDSRVLALANIARACRVFIACGSDALNLEIADRAAAQLRDAQSLAGTASAPEPMIILVGIESGALVRQLDREDRFARPPNVAPAVELLAFNLARLAARELLRRYPLVDLAQLRGRERIHLVLIGWSSFVVELLEQLTRLWPVPGWTRPLVHLLIADAAAVHRELEVVHPEILAGLTLEVLLIPLGQSTGLVPAPLLAQIETAEAPVTAVIVDQGDDAANVGAALGLRERTLAAGQWLAPIFVPLTRRGSLWQLLEQNADHADPAVRVVPVGAREDLCAFEAIAGARVALAKRLHQSYRELCRQHAAQRPAADQFSGSDSDQPWGRLHQTYRQATLRAVDHVPFKLFAAGLYCEFDRVETLELASRATLIADAAALERLAACEHRSWEMDRYLEGWRPGPFKDLQRRWNPYLGVPYEQLDERVKDYDRAQIRALERELQSSGRCNRPARPHLCLGIAPPGDATAAAELERWLVRWGESRLAVLDSARDHFVSLLLAADCAVSERVAIAVLTDLAARAVEHRLVIMRTPECRRSAEDYAAALQQSAREHRSGPGPALNWTAAHLLVSSPPGTAPHSPSREAVTAYLERSCDILLRLVPPSEHG